MPNGTHDSLYSLKLADVFTYNMLYFPVVSENLKAQCPEKKTLTKALFYAGIKLKLPLTFRFKVLFTFLCRRKIMHITVDKTN